MIRFVKGTALPLSILFAGLLAVATSANADTIEYYSLAWSGAVATPDPPPNATGTIGLDLTTLPNPQFGSVDITSSITSLSVTVTGSPISTDNGTWTLADLGSTLWSTDGATLNMYTQLVGQATADGPWAFDASTNSTNFSSGDFNLFFVGPNSPSGCAPFTLCTGSGYGMGLVSFQPLNAVPEPGSLPLLASGLAMLSAFGLWRRRRKKTGA